MPSVIEVSNLKKSYGLKKAVDGLLPVENFHILMLMSLMVAVISTSMYNWLAEYDFYEQYMFLPISRDYINKSKLIAYGFFTFIVGAPPILTVYAFTQAPIVFLPIAFLFCASITAYTTSVTTYLCGLTPAHVCDFAAFKHSSN